MTDEIHGGAGGDTIATATPYPWPYHGSFDPARTALVALRDPYWRLESPATLEADHRLEVLADALSEAGALVVLVTQAPPRPLLRTMAASVSSTLRRIGGPDAVSVQAEGTSAFFGSALDHVLRERFRSDLVVAGWGLEGPVHSTLRAANDRGYECLLVPDASTSLEDGLAEPACSMVRFSGGIFGAVADSHDLLGLVAEPTARSFAPT
jgi:nicotinamidase-related amidase